jgi:hypothetical protein
VIPEIIVLALASTVRPTSLAAVYALLAHESRRSFLLAYVITGLLVTIAFGLLVVYALHGIHPHFGRHKANGIADLIGGALAVLFGFAVLTGHVGGKGEDAPAPHVQMDGRHLTLRRSALAGPATHIPGLFYLIALNVIVAHNPRVASGTIAVVTYNAIWFALPIIALAMCFIQPAAALAVIEAVQGWARRHSRVLLLTVSFGVGAALLVHGAVTV